MNDEMNLALAAAMTFSAIGIAVVISWLAKRAMARTELEPGQRYNARRLIRFTTWSGVVVVVVIAWQPLGGSLGPALGLATAGVAFAMQEVIGAIAGWFNITFGGIFTIGDRIEIGDVRGDVIDISLLKTRLMEIGDSERSWVRGAQYTGRVVTVSNKASFTAPVFNYSAYFDYIWDEVHVAIPHHGNWLGAAKVLEEEATRLSSSTGARSAMNEVRTKFPVPAAEVEPLVFATADEDYVHLSARFVVPIRSVRAVRDEITRCVYERLDSEGIEVISPGVIQQAREHWTPVAADQPAHRSGFHSANRRVEPD
ncbi:MAG: mechanosensitive ion channel family protein [Deltaproteobacteria bacterium]|nr:mechanosensitive ion channel family protein [Deltaproteobacteria bacterium]